VAISVAEVCDPRRYPGEEAIRAARRNAEERSSYDIEVSHYLTQQLLLPQADVDVVERALEILSAIAPPTRLHGALRTALAHDDPRVRSKAAGALGQCVADLPLLQRLLADGDPRVRANTLEALWHSKGGEIEAAFLRGFKDSHHRVVANAAYGLYLFDPEKHFDKVSALIGHPHSGYRAAGAWLLGKIGNPKHLPMLRPLLLEKSADVRGAAFRTLKILRVPDAQSA
jgi:HEAT repeat protein